MKRTIPAVLVALAVTGCAGGWRNAAPPGTAASAASTAPAAKAADTGQPAAPTGDARGIALIRGLDGALAKAGGYAIEGTVHVKYTESDHRQPFRYFRAADGRERAEVTGPKGVDLIVFDGQTLWAYSPEEGRYASRPWKAGDPIDSESPEIGEAARTALSALPATYALLAGTVLEGGTKVSLAGPVRLDVGGQHYECDRVDAGDPMASIRLWLDRASGLPLRAEYRLGMCGRTIPCLGEFISSKLTLGEPADPALFTFTPPPGARQVAATAHATPPPGTGAVHGASGVTFAWKGGGGSVAVAGEFNAWNTTADPLAKQADGSWALTRKLEPGRYMYKFVIDGTNWKEDPNAQETADDGYGGKNSVVIVGGATPAASAAPVAKAAPAAPAASAGGVTFAWKGGGGSVAVAGEFNAWNTTADPLTKQADGSWALTRKLEPGRYMYKFVIDGTNWKEDPNAQETADDGYGGKNSVVIVGGAAAPAATAAAPAAATATPAGKGRAPVPTADGVVFTFAGAATSVALAGAFNGWAIAADPLAKQADGTWSITKKLPPGTHEYKFVVNGTTWKIDEANPESKADPYGGKNSVVTVK